SANLGVGNRSNPDSKQTLKNDVEVSERFALTHNHGVCNDLTFEASSKDPIDVFFVQFIEETERGLHDHEIANFAALNFSSSRHTALLFTKNANPSHFGCRDSDLDTVAEVAR